MTFWHLLIMRSRPTLAKLALPALHALIQPKTSQNHPLDREKSHNKKTARLLARRALERWC